MQLHIATYSGSKLNYNDNLPTAYTVEDLTAGPFFTYMGYDPEGKRVYVYIKLYNG